jgi:hypothetical protein
MPAHHMPIWHFLNCDNARVTLTISVGADNIAAACGAAAHRPRRSSGGPTSTGLTFTSCPEVFLFGAIWLLTFGKEISAVSSI